ncbi:MAG TPA: hypothetical protein VLR27_09805 [Acidimicrobiales bacterium]|nr:hypothetical protein [Acidimicrobiales bacterium]
MPSPEAMAAALVRAHAEPTDGLPDGRRLVDYAESSRTGDWSLRSALVRFAQPEPTRASAVLELIRRTDGALKPHRRQLEAGDAPTHPGLEPGTFVDDGGQLVVDPDADRVIDAPAADLARAVLRLPEGDAVVASYRDAADGDPTFDAIPLLVVALELDAIAEALVAWACVHDGPPPVAVVDERAAAAFTRLAALDVPRETGGRPPGRGRS